MKNVHRIEAFDNSHLFGTFYVGGMVVFDDFVRFFVGVGEVAGYLLFG